MADTGELRFSDIEQAAARIRGAAHRTPVLTSRTADAVTGGQLFFKCENFQRTGAFKFRGAFNAISRFTDEQRRAGVLTYSSGNHAQAIALSASLLGVSAAILMPHDAPALKIAATKGADRLPGRGGGAARRGPGRRQEGRHPDQRRQRRPGALRRFGRRLIWQTQLLQHNERERTYDSC